MIQIKITDRLLLCSFLFNVAHVELQRIILLIQIFFNIWSPISILLRISLWRKVQSGWLNILLLSSKFLFDKGETGQVIAFCGEFTFWLNFAREHIQRRCGRLTRLEVSDKIVLLFLGTT